MKLLIPTIIVSIIMLLSFLSKFIITPNLLHNLGSVNPLFYPPNVLFFSILGDSFLVWFVILIIFILIDQFYLPRWL